MSYFFNIIRETVNVLWQNFNSFSHNVAYTREDCVNSKGTENHVYPLSLVITIICAAQILLHQADLSRPLCESSDITWLTRREVIFKE